MEEAILSWWRKLNFKKSDEESHLGPEEENHLRAENALGEKPSKNPLERSKKPIRNFPSITVHRARKRFRKLFLSVLSEVIQFAVSKIFCLRKECFPVVVVAAFAPVIQIRACSQLEIYSREDVWGQIRGLCFKFYCMIRLIFHIYILDS